MGVVGQSNKYGGSSRAVAPEETGGRNFEIFE